MTGASIKTSEKVLEVLYDRRNFVSMEELAQAAGGVRQALRSLDDLRRRNHLLELAPLGVRLVRPVTPDTHLIQRDLRTARVGSDVLCFQQVASTNDVAMGAAKGPHADGLVVIAESQRRGRGRLGRKWISPPGNIFMSILLVDDCKDAGRIGHEALTIAAGVAVAEAIERSCGAEPRLKWPNDVLLDGRKAGGILVEMRQVSRKRCVVVGVGINVASAPPDEQVDVPATSLEAQTGENVERIEVIRALLRRLDHWVAQIGSGSTQYLRQSWMRRCDMVNERIAVICSSKRYVGRVLDVSPLEGLVLALDDGQRVHLPASTSTVCKSLSKSP